MDDSDTTLGLTTAAISALLGTELRTLEELVVWGRNQQPAAMIIDVIVQDEYTHDVVIELRTGAGDEFYLAFDSG